MPYLRASLSGLFLLFGSLQGIRVPGRHHLLRRLGRARPVGPLRGQGRPGVAAAIASVPLAGGRRAGVAHRRREEAQQLPVRPLEAVLPGRRRRRGRGAPRIRRLDADNSGCTALSMVKQGDLMVVVNVGDSRAVRATTSDDGDVTTIQLTVDFMPDLPRKSS